VSGALSLAVARREFEPENVYVNTASIGLPPRRALDALAGSLDTWRTGRAEAAAYDATITRARERFAGLVGTTPARVAIGNQVSTFGALIASAWPPARSCWAPKKTSCRCSFRSWRTPTAALL
jgi:selenocysteine lyase/cysteine desulfurase